MVFCSSSHCGSMVWLRRYAKLLLPLAVAGLALAQPQQAMQQAPDCGPWYFQTSADGNSTVVLNGAGDNRFIGCTSWTVAYSSTGFTGVSLTFQSAPGATAIGTWVSFAGTTDSGTNPMVSTSGGTSTFSNPTNVAISFVRLNVDVTGTGTVSAVYYGFRTGPSAGGGGGGGGTISCDAPGCVVIGPEAPGAAATEDPVQVSGVNPDGEVERFLLDANGRAQTSALEACPNTLRVNVAATGPTEVIPLTAGQTIRVCGFTVGVDAGGAIDMSFVYGTGANCGTGTTTLAGPFDQITAFGPTFSQGAPLTVPEGNALCLTNSAATAVTGVVIYAKY